MVHTREGLFWQAGVSSLRLSRECVNVSAPRAISRTPDRRAGGTGHVCYAETSSGLHLIISSPSTPGAVVLTSAVSMNKLEWVAVKRLFARARAARRPA